MKKQRKHVEVPFWHPACQEAFILDWDGVLAETSLDFQPLYDKYFHGRRVMLLEVLPSMETPERDALERDILELEMQGASRAVPVPGAKELLGFLKERGIPWAVVSRNCGAAVRLAAETVGISLPRHTYTRDDKPVKPDPRALWTAALALGIPPERCLMVGDFLYDLMGAMRAGMRSVLVQCPSSSWPHWGDLAFEKLVDFVEFLHTQKSVHPREYAHIASVKELERRWSHSFAIPKGASNPGVLAFQAAFWGCGVLAAPQEMILEPSQWNLWHGLDPAFLGKSIMEALVHTIRPRFPLVTLRESKEQDLVLPTKPQELPAFFIALEQER